MRLGSVAASRYGHLTNAFRPLPRITPDRSSTLQALMRPSTRIATWRSACQNG